MRRFIIILSSIILLHIGHSLHANERTDTLSTILKNKSNDLVKQQQLTTLFYHRFLLSSQYDHQVKATADSLKKYNISGSTALGLLAQISILRRLNNLAGAEKILVEAIGITQKEQQRYLLYYFYNTLAYVQTDQNNAVDAIHNYRQAKKIAHELSDLELILSTDIGISDIFTAIGLYQQALIYLNSSQQQVENPVNSRSPSRATIYLNKAEIFFRISKLDSLSHYCQLYSRYGAKSYDFVRNLKRLGYYRLILSNQPQKAIVLIRDLLATGNLYYKNVDRWYLAQSLYAANSPDSAVMEAHQILLNDKKGPSPIRLNAFKLIATIAEDKNQRIEANMYFKLALAESEGFTIKMRSVDLLSTELRQDRLDAAYQAQYLLYHKERTVLFASISVTILIILIIYLFYRNLRQKSRYQKLLHETRSRELAFINSHEVRKPLANILAICGLLKDKENTVEENHSYYEILDQQVKEMDHKLREVEMKLRENN
jgi:hypothetical protein